MILPSHVCCIPFMFLPILCSSRFIKVGSVSQRLSLYVFPACQRLWYVHFYRFFSYMCIVYVHENQQLLSNKCHFANFCKIFAVLQNRFTELLPPYTQPATTTTFLNTVNKNVYMRTNATTQKSGDHPVDHVMSSMLGVFFLGVSISVASIMTGADSVNVSGAYEVPLFLVWYAAHVWLGALVNKTIGLIHDSR